MAGWYSPLNHSLASVLSTAAAVTDHMPSKFALKQKENCQLLCPRFPITSASLNSQCLSSDQTSSLPVKRPWVHPSRARLSRTKCKQGFLSKAEHHTCPLHTSCSLTMNRRVDHSASPMAMSRLKWTCLLSPIHPLLCLSQLSCSLWHLQEVIKGGSESHRGNKVLHKASPDSTE